VLVGSLLFGGVAWAQQGLVVEPWHAAPPPAAAPVPALRALPASGLGAPQSEGPSAAKVDPAPAPRVAPQWSPPVVELLVDPWAKANLATPASRSRWVPTGSEIVDPWAGRAATRQADVANRPAAGPERRVAVRPAPSARATIF
jgi:hypothetical protein